MKPLNLDLTEDISEFEDSIRQAIREKKHLDSDLVVFEHAFEGILWKLFRALQRLSDFHGLSIFRADQNVVAMFGPGIATNVAV